MVFSSPSRFGHSIFRGIVDLHITIAGYVVAAVAFGVFAIVLVTVWRPRVKGSLLTAACLAATVWGALLAWAATEPSIDPARVLVIEMAHDFAWLYFLSSLLSGAIAVESNRLVRHGGVVLGGVLLFAAVLLNIGGIDRLFGALAGNLLVMGSIATSLYALVGVEQLYRNARPSQQNGLKFLCLGLAAMFSYDIFLYSNAVIDGEIRSGFWAARGFVVALTVPFLVIAVRRVPISGRGIFASRQIVFYTTTLFAAGMYLALIGVAGYFIQKLDLAWGDVLSLVFFSAAIIGFAALVLSEQLRARIRVWTARHFFERKYDYRNEWLRLTETLTGGEDGLPIKKRAIKALAQIVDSPSGVIWLSRNADRNIDVVAGWNCPAGDRALGEEAPLAVFLRTKGWVVDVAELATNPVKYSPLTRADVPDSTRDAGFVIPLFHESELMGFIELETPKTAFSPSFEDYELLKTAGQQVASYLAQEQATERLAESRQFEAFNRFTAFIMHDLKNAIAQQSLVVENAERHKHNPEFIDDAMETIKRSVARMRKVLGHLKQGAVEQSVESVDLTKLILQVESQCADREPVPHASVPGTPLLVRANKERLKSALSHAVRNAQEACSASGEVRIELHDDGTHCRIVVRDTGKGMDPAFIRDRLFRPFDSTKGAEGMGIGAYQVREAVRAAGGEIEVASEAGKGTTLVMRLPVLTRPSA